MEFSSPNARIVASYIGSLSIPVFYSKLPYINSIIYSIKQCFATVSIRLKTCPAVFIQVVSPPRAWSQPVPLSSEATSIARAPTLAPPEATDVTVVG
jgi:hypothetical protein